MKTTTINYSIKMNRGALVGMVIGNQSITHPTRKAAREWLRIVTAKGIAGELPYTIEDARIDA